MAGGKTFVAPAPGVEGIRYTDQYLDDVALDYSQYTQTLKVLGIDAINNMIENLLLTIPGERPYEPEFGSAIPAMIWEPCDLLTAHRMRTAAIDPINRWIPYLRVDLPTTRVTPIPDQQIFDLQIGYMIRVGGLKGIYKLSLARFNNYKLFF